MSIARNCPISIGLDPSLHVRERSATPWRGDLKDVKKPCGHVTGRACDVTSGSRRETQAVPRSYFQFARQRSALSNSEKRLPSCSMR
jgi:hypothetical protein